VTPSRLTPHDLDRIAAARRGTAIPLALLIAAAILAVFEALVIAGLWL
jgi:hypothetical protein